MEQRQRGYIWLEGRSSSGGEDVDKPGMTVSGSWALPSSQN